MNTCWSFLQARPGDRARETQVEKFFNSDVVLNRANAIVREGIQNSLDAAAESVAVHIRICVGTWTETEKAARLDPYTSRFLEHVNADDVREKLSDPPKPQDEFRYLLFEDFGTSGLTGEPDQWWIDEHGGPNPFFNYFRAEGISDKVEGKRGRHGVGRLVFMFASRVHSIIALTHRDDGRRLLMGTSVLRNHRVLGKPYLPDGWFGVPSTDVPGLTLPIEDPAFLSEFVADFGISRTVNQSGLSVVVPWLGVDVTGAAVTRAVLNGYFHPILRNKLTVDVVDESGASSTINAATIDSMVAQQDPAFAAALRPMINLAKAAINMPESEWFSLEQSAIGAPKWANDCMSDAIRPQIQAKLDSGGVTAIRVPVRVRTKAGVVTDSHFDVFLHRDSSVGDGQVAFIREGIIIAGVRPRRTSGVRALVVIEEGALATFLGDSENPSHTEWQKELVREKYSYHSATIEYVVQSVPSILTLLNDAQKKPDTSVLIDLFSLPTDDEAEKKIKRRKKPRAGDDPDEPGTDLPPTLKRFAIQKVAGGFTIRRGGLGAARPPMLALKVAYGVRRGSPFIKYNSADFRLGIGGINCEFQGCEAFDFADNWMLIRVNSDDFEVKITGFDPNRDLHVDVKVKEEELADATSS